MQFETVLDTASQLLAAIDPQQQHSDLLSHLQRTQAIRIAPTRGPANEPDLVCVDGGVAHEQTDALTWIAAVGVSSDLRSSVPATMVMPVSSETDRARSMLMALCELAAALDTADRSHVVWMDGSLATPLISIATGLLTSDPTTAELVCATLADCNTDTLIGDYVHYGLQGRLRALPKQDTASGYCQLWAAQLGERSGAWLKMQRDRIAATSVLKSGEYLRPRRADEALRVTAKATADAPKSVREWAHVIDELLGHWREELPVFVTYVLPRGMPLRAVKIEYTLPADVDDADIDDVADSTAAALCAKVSETIIGTRVIEPFPQHQADTFAKREVTSLITQLMGAAARTFSETHPAGIRHYRT